MGRAVILAVIVASAALACAGCGAAATAEPAGLPVAAPAAKRAAVEPTDGRLGAATTVRVGSRPRELSPGGRLDVTPDQLAERRDGVGAGAACGNSGVAPGAATLPAVSEATLCLLNGERADHGLAPLALNAKLSAAATAYAHDLVDGSYFSHAGRDGSDVRERIKRVGYIPSNAGWMLGENLAWGTGALGTPGAIMQAWMNSPGHRANILGAEYREVGIGVAPGNPAQADGAGATYATEFGVIEGAAPVAAAPRQAGEPKARKARKRAKRGARARQSRKTQTARSRDRGTSAAKAGKGRAKSRGPKARSAI